MLVYEGLRFVRFLQLNLLHVLPPARSEVTALAGALDPGACGLRLALLSCAGGWLALRTPAVAVDRARVVFLNILAFGLCVLVAQWIRHRRTEPGIAGSSPAGVISKA